jgi:hypothetical protein
MAVWESLIFVLAFGMTGADAGLCKHASSVSTKATATLGDIVHSSVPSASTIGTSNPPFSSIVSFTTQGTFTLKESTTAMTEIKSVATIHKGQTHTVSARETTTTFTGISKPKPTPLNLLRDPGFDDPSGLSFSQPWVLKPSKGKSISELRNNYPFKSGPMVL